MARRIDTYAWVGAGIVTLMAVLRPSNLPNVPASCCTWNPFLWDTTTWSAVTALATILLAVFASLAWIISRKTLQTATDDALEARKLALASMNAQQRSEEIAALSAYIHALTELSEILDRSPAQFHVPIAQNNVSIGLQMDLGYPAYLNNLCRNVDVAGAQWRIHHPSIDDAFSRFASFEYFFIESVRLWTTIRSQADMADDLRELNFGFGKILASNVRVWQSLPSQRDRIEGLLPSQLDYFREEIKAVTGTTLS